MHTAEQEDVWTHVPAKGSRNRKPAALTQPMNPPSRDLTLAKLSAEFTSKLKTWRQSPCRKTVLQILLRIQPDGGWQLRKAVCLGSGSFSRDNLECRRRSIWQFVVFYDIAQHLLKEEEGEETIGMYAQEPAFTELDKEFLASLQIQMLDVSLGDGNAGLGPAKDVLGSETFLFEPFIDMNAVMLSEMLQAGVGFYVGSSIRGILQRRSGSEVVRLAKEFHDGHEMLKFPSFEVDPNVLDGIAIYWKEEKDEDEDE